MRFIESSEHRLKGRLIQALIEQFYRTFTPDFLYCSNYQLTNGCSKTVRRRLPPSA